MASSLNTHCEHNEDIEGWFEGLLEDFDRDPPTRKKSQHAAILARFLGEREF